MAEQNPDFPVAAMPRMGRRNAIIPSDQDIRADDIGAFSPIHLLHRSRIPEVHSKAEQQAIYPKELKQGKSPPPHRIAAPPPTGMLRKGYKPVTVEPVDPLEPPRSKRRRGSNLTEARIAEKMAATEKIQFENEKEHRVTTVIPWKMHDPYQTTIAEERRKIFESFNKTSIEPPETPQVSESKILRMMSKIKQKKKKETKRDAKRGSESEESLELPNSNAKRAKTPYSNIAARVNTRWNSPQAQDTKNGKQAAVIVGKGVVSPQKQGKNLSKSMSRTKTAVVKKPGPVMKPKAVPKRETGTPVRAQAQPGPKTGSAKTANNNNNRLVINYPASEEVNDNIAKLPLTLGPRYNPRKAMGYGITQGAQNRAELVGDTTTRLYGTLPPHQRIKYEQQQQIHQEHPPPPYLFQGAEGAHRSTMFNLHRINNVGNGNVNAKNKEPNPTGAGLVVVRRPNASGVGGFISVEMKKPPPPVTTIQAPPSPFLASVISIPSQINEIPVNGEVKAAPVPVKSTANTNKSGKGSRKAAPKVDNENRSNKGNNNINNNNKTQPPPQRGGPLGNARRNVGAVRKIAPPLAKAPPAPPKIVPTLGAAPNKYNNIYIGPYSGSDSEGELPNPGPKAQ